MSHRKPGDYLEPYRRAADLHGAGFDATLWRNRDWQRIRFDVMIGMIDFTNRVIVDAGCGSGDFAAHLLDRTIRFGQYTGIDGLAAQIERARGRQLDRCTFIQGDFVHHPEIMAAHSPDVICFSGSLNTMDETTVRSVLHDAWEAARVALIFNFLSNRAPLDVLARETGPAVRLDTLAMIEWALERSPRVQFRQDYLDGHDATICIHR